LISLENSRSIAQEKYAMSYDLSLSAHSAQTQSQAGYLARTIENWQARKSVRSLLKLEDHVLHDAGTLRGDVEWAAHLPLSINAALALEERTRTGLRI
jgi:uncharacterized protein YjiS (DUF1127 family)